jgi:signal transduction histidine kinase
MWRKISQDRFWRGWHFFFKLTESFGARLLGVSLLAALAFGAAYLLQGPNASQIPVVTIAAAVLMALCGGAGLGLLYTLLLGAAVDYFFIPPVGQIFVTTEARQHYFLVTLTAAFIGLLVSSLRMAFQRIDAAMRSAGDAVKARDEMVAVISHELKNPITALQTATVLIQRLVPKGPENAQVLKVVDKLPSSIQRMSLLVSDLLDITRLESRVLKLHPVECSILEIAREVVTSFASTAQNKSVDLRIAEFPPEASRGFCDPTRTAQTLENLLSNAIKFTEAGGSVRVSASKEDDQIQISVTDTGSGIPDDYLPYVFDRFWQAKESAFKGTGLGLAIAKGLVEAQGGTIKVSSKQGQGSSFFFTLPSKAVLKPPAKKAG